MLIYLAVAVLFFIVLLVRHVADVLDYPEVVGTSLIRAPVVIFFEAVLWPLTLYRFAKQRILFELFMRGVIEWPETQPLTLPRRYWPESPEGRRAFNLLTRAFHGERKNENDIRARLADAVAAHALLTNAAEQGDRQDPVSSAYTVGGTGRPQGRKGP